jgi:hypothetical protein
MGKEPEEPEEERQSRRRRREIETKSNVSRLRKGTNTHLSTLSRSQINGFDEMPPRREKNMSSCKRCNVEKPNHIRRG